jgi:2-(1,2-epoxy-1,2-dihydrophenyl)acetyl-CoA isomerase
MAFETLHLTTDAATGVATLTLDRPPRNAIERRMAADLERALGDVCDDDAVRAVVLTGAGAGFCAGGDLKVLAGELADPAAARAFLGACHRSILAIAEMEKPVIAAVNGDAAGAGWSLALACDLIVAARGARFIMAFVKIGLVPDLGGAWYLTQLVGAHKAREWMMLGDVVTAEEAARFGVVNRMVEPGEALPISSFSWMKTRFSRRMCETSLSGSRMLPNLRAPTGQASRHAGYLPARVRWMQKWHFSITPTLRGRLPR